MTEVNANMEERHSALDMFRAQREQLQSITDQAKRELQDEFNSALEAAIHVRQEYFETFNEWPTLPEKIAGFTVKGAEKTQVTSSRVLNAKIGGLKRSLAANLRRREDLVARGIDTGTVDSNIERVKKELASLEKTSHSAAH